MRSLRLSMLILVVTATLAGGCTSGQPTRDKAGGPGEPVELRMANTYGDLGDLPAIAYFVNRVHELSGGTVRINVVHDWAGFATDAEQQVVRAVAVGDVDLGWVGTRAFDKMGIQSLRALTAPMLVDSYVLQQAVIDSGITAEMLPSLENVGVVGLAVLADGLRKPIGVAGPILGPADWRGISFGTVPSDGQAEAIRALGAVPVEVFGATREEAIRKGTIQGFEFSLYNYNRDPRWGQLAPYVTSNVNMWPQMDVLIAGPARYAALMPDQRRWLGDASRDAAARSAELMDKDAEAVVARCKAGARFAEASAADLAWLEAAFAQVHRDLEQDPETNEFIARIEAMKTSMPAEPPLTIPAGCTGKAGVQVPRTTGASAVRSTARIAASSR